MAHKMKGFILRLSDEEFEKLDKQAKNTGLTRQDYLRYLCRGIRFKPCPDEELKEVGAEIHAVSNEINRIAMAANSTGVIDELAYVKALERLRIALDKIVEYDP